MAIAPQPAGTIRQRLLTRRVSRFNVDLADIRVDMRFQREVDLRMVRNIRTNFLPTALGAIVLTDLPPTTPGDPRYAVIDGQTRLAVSTELNEAMRDPSTALDLGFPAPTALDAFVVHDAEPDECAYLFRVLNFQRLTAVRDRQRVSVTEGNPTALDAKAQFAAAGHVALSNNKGDDTVTTADITVGLRLVQWGLKHNYPTLLTEALEIQKLAFAHPSAPSPAGTVHPRILQATADLLIKKPDLVKADLASVMRSHGDILFEVEKLQDSKTYSMKPMTTRIAIRTVLVDRYNRSRKPADRIRF